MIEGVYYITDAATEAEIERCRQVLAGGVRLLQYRDKQASGERKKTTARRLLELCSQAGACFIVNDDPVLAREVGANGVHIGQTDGSVAKARDIVGPQALIGVSCRTVEQAEKAAAQGADYIAVGSMYPTGTKAEAELVGPERLTQVRAAVDKPIVAIGGIDRDRAGDLFARGADAVAVISALRDDPKPALAARELGLAAIRRHPERRGRVLSVAGSDSGGGAGIQADLKTITLLGGYGMTALTALTAQNTLGVSGIHPCPADFVERQITAVLDDIGTEVVKTGMLFDAAIVATVAKTIAERHLIAVVDPVMIAKGGAPLLQRDAVEALTQNLLPHTYLLTPNVPEAEALSGIAIDSEADMERAAERLRQLGARNVLIKGGHLAGEAVDILVGPGIRLRLPAERRPTRNTHGTGCSYSAAIATLLASGHPLPEAAQRAKRFITAAIAGATDLGSGHGPLNHWEGAKAVDRIQESGVRSQE
ncbi:MAG: bifunctional hydroxymethylpyrimidine kinase/phosphomethylpyrimidine kinase [Geothermobacteraceae bacterium]